MVFALSKLSYRAKIQSISVLKDPRLYLKQHQDSIHLLVTSSVLQGPKAGLKGHGYSLNLQNQESQNLENRCIKYQGPYPNQDQDPKPQSGIYSILQIPKFKEHRCSLHL